MNKVKILLIALGVLIVSILMWSQIEPQGESFNENRKKLLVLIIASDNHPAYLALQDIWQTYMHSDPKNITAYFIKGDPELDTPSHIEGNVLYTKVVDNYKPGILQKTLYSLEALNDQLPQYDYVLRTNLSSFYDFPKLLAFLETLPKKNCYAAVALWSIFEFTENLKQIPYGSGAGFILSSDLAQMMARQKEEVLERSHKVPDDELIGHYFHKRNIPIIPLARLDFQTKKDWLALKDNLPDNIFHFRAKSNYNYRTLEDAYGDELYILSELTKKIYPSQNLVADLSHSYPLNIKLSTMHAFYAAYPSDINEHLPVLRKLAKECGSATEIGIRSMVSTWAILQGLSENKIKKRSYVGIDLNTPPLVNLLLAKNLAQENQIAFQFVKGNDMELEMRPTDLLFIDSLHTYAHLTYELEKFSPKVNKYIALHDTSEPWGDQEDTEYRGDYSEYPAEIDRTKKGLWPAVVDFLNRHPEWTLQERRLNNHGFTILRRKA